MDHVKTGYDIRDAAVIMPANCCLAVDHPELIGRMNYKTLVSFSRYLNTEGHRFPVEKVRAAREAAKVRGSKLTSANLRRIGRPGR